MTIDRNTLIARIDTLAEAEKITKKELGSLSRDMLVYLVLDDSNDIDMLNRLMSVLSPVNFRVSIEYFNHFVPFKAEYEEDTNIFIRFGAKLKGERKLERYLTEAKEFLSVEQNNIWTWQNDNIDVAKVPNYSDKIEKVVKKALADKENGLTQADVIGAVMSGGVEIDTIIALLNSMSEAA